MASVTLVEAAKLSQNPLVAGVIENVITVNQMFQVLPFQAISGNAISYSRENALGDVDVEPVGGTIAGKAAATFTQVTSSLTTIIGDAEVNGLIQATMSNSGNDQTAIQVASKAKSAGRKYQDMLINGTGASDQFDGLLNLTAAGQQVDTGANGSVFTFPIMDELMDLVTAKDGQVDYFCMNARTRRSYRSALRALGGASIDETFELPDGGKVIAYSGVPVFRNDWIPIDDDKGTSTGVCGYIFAGCFDDGSQKVGLAGLTAANAAGIQVEDAGVSETKDEHIWRVKWYCGLALFSEKAIAYADGITN